MGIICSMGGYMENYYQQIQEILENVSDGAIKGLALGTQDNLREAGMNSITFVRLIVELEAMFTIEFDDEAFLIENFDTIQKINSNVVNMINLN